MTFSHPNSFLRESGKLYVLYLSAGAAAIPAGAIYACLAINGYDRWWTALPAIALGFWMAIKMWKYVERKLFRFEYPSMTSANRRAYMRKETQAGEAVLILGEFQVFEVRLNAATSQSLPLTNTQAENENATPYAFT